jgi:hypothetical protein
MARLLKRLYVWTAIMAVILLVPIPIGNDTLGAHDGVLVVAFVFGIGMILYDTLFYDHFRL